MYILAIETTGAFASVALAETGAAPAEGSVHGAGADASADSQFSILTHVEGHDRYSHLQNLTPQIQQVISDAGISIDDLSAIAVSNGPGSFTGIRIGVSTARAMSQIKDIPCIPVSSLEALALRSRAAGSERDENTMICPILDARRSQVYGGGYIIEGTACGDLGGIGPLREVIQAGPYMIEEFMELAAAFDHIFMMGDGIDTCGDKINALRQEGIAFAPAEIRYQRAEEVAMIGAIKLAAGETVSFENLKPEYMRMAEAERKLRAKQAEEGSHRNAGRQQEAGGKPEAQEKNHG